MPWQTEPLACIWWACLVVFLVTWAWAAMHYDIRGHRKATEEYKEALKYVRHHHGKPQPADVSDEDWARAQLRCDEILAGNETWPGRWYY